ncbi:hypothetical protein [Lentilactobacillus kefiri]|nr:hypothetical protein [Lentilactobacillus kefiri]MCP9370015.1 hypothetical protein [Lentilactobacillus kefiri]
MAKEKSDSKLIKKQEAIASDLLSDKIFGTKKMQKKINKLMIIFII